MEMSSRKRTEDGPQDDIAKKLRKCSEEEISPPDYVGSINSSSAGSETRSEDSPTTSTSDEGISVSTQTSDEGTLPSRKHTETGDAVREPNDQRTSDSSSVHFRLGSLENKVEWLSKEVQFIRELLQCITRLLPWGPSYKYEHALPGFSSFTSSHGRKFANDDIPRRFSNESGTIFYSPSRTDALSANIRERKMEERFGSSEIGNRQLKVASTDQQRSYANEKDLYERTRTSEAYSAPNSSFKDGGTCIRDSNSGRGGNVGETASVATEPSPITLPSDRNSKPSEAATAASERRQNDKLFSDLPPVNSISALDIIYLWEHGTKDLPPIGMWSPERRAGYGDFLYQWDKVYKLFKTDCHGDIRSFIAKYSDERGDLLPVSTILDESRNQFDNRHAEVNQQSSSDIALKKLVSAAPKLDRIIDSVTVPTPSSQPPYFLLPRKISGRKVSAKDVIRMWNDGYGDMPPIKSWTPAQKLKQQSKISRWKKIVDIMKLECDGDMKLFEEKFSNESGTLLPVAAIIAKYESMQGTTDSVHSRPPTMSYLGERSSCSEDQAGRNSDADDGSSEDDDAASDVYLHNSSSVSGSVLRESGVNAPISSPHPSYGSSSFTSVSSAFSSFPGVSSSPRSSDVLKLSSLIPPPSSHRTFSDYSSLPSTSASLIQARSASDMQIPVLARHDSRAVHEESRSQEKELELKRSLIFGQDSLRSFRPEVPFPPFRSWRSSNDRSKYSTETSFSQAFTKPKEQLNSANNVTHLENEVTSPFTSPTGSFKDTRNGLYRDRRPSSSSGNEKQHIESADDDYSHFILPRKINGRKVSAKDVIHMWYHGFNNAPPIGNWTPAQKIKQQSKISRWKKIVDIFEQECQGNMDQFETSFSNKLGELLPIAAVIAKYESDKLDDSGSVTTKTEM